MKKKNNTVKLNRLFLLVIVFLFVAIIAKLSYVSLSEEVDGMNLSNFASNRNTAKETLYAKRGVIYDINGEILAQNVNSYTVIAFIDPIRTTDANNPQHVEDKERTAKELAEVLEISEDSILKRLNYTGYQIELARGISELKKEEIQGLGLDGISFISSTKRYYKNGKFASYIIGYARKNDSGEIAGEMGIESYFNEALKGRDGYREYQKDAYGYQIPNTPVYTPEEPEDGSNIYLTIDSQIQLIAEKAVSTLSDTKMSWLTLSVADAKTGAIVASATSPNFNLNTLDGLDYYLNPLVSYTYEPGSTMKIFSYLAAMEEGIYDGSANYLSGTIDVADSTIKDFNNVGWGTITYDKGFAYSSNVAATKLALALGTDKLKSYYKLAGFGALTGIELPNEEAGIIDFKYQTELANASFGHGITITPIQMIQALTAVANNGKIIKPYIVDKIVDANGNITYQAETKEVATIASEESIKKISDLMYDVVYSGLTDARYYKTENVSIIGKTGTAQIATSGGYLKGKYDYIRSFAGLFPAEDPQYIVYIAVRQYEGSIKDIADVTKTIVEEVSKIMNITEEESAADESKIINLTNYISRDVTSTKESLENLGLDVYVLGEGDYIINQYPLKGAYVVIGTKIFLLTNDSNYVMPNIIGWSANEVNALCNLIGLKVEFSGYGIVVSQSIKEKEMINLEDILKIELDI